MENTDNYSISELATDLEISPSSIRFYEEKGLINPERTKGNQRIYSLKDRARLKLILRGKRFGFSLSEISEMIGFANSEPEEREQIERTLKYSEKKLQEIAQRKEELDLIEKDILEMREKFIKRLKSLNKK
ncbi:MAG: MerR family transcriptional regulator [Thermodesulfobacteriota bacterium]